jgi:glycerophosphoryl diester phosphodiesterase
MVNETKETPFSIEESFITSKTGHANDCEDALFISNKFIAVVDGATSKTERRWNGETGGKVAARILGETLHLIPDNASIYDAMDIITVAIHDFYVQHDVLEIVRVEPVQRLIASAILLSLSRNEVWLIGDCQCLLDTTHIVYSKKIDQISSEARAMFLETELLRGATIAGLSQNDTGRAFIMPLLQRQQYLENNSLANDYEFAVFDGFPISHDKVFIHKISDEAETIVLATDGYPELKDSLEASEKALQEVLTDDPLLFRRYKSTKGLQEGNISYDDRAYVKLIRQS